MKILKIVLLFFIFYGLYSCNNVNKKKNENSIEKNEVNNNFIRTFEGDINGKYEIMMKITSDNGKVKGSYYYKKNNVELELKGNLQSDGKINLQEFDAEGNQTGIFQGFMENNQKIVGKWKKPNGKNEMKFSLIESNSNYSAKKIIEHKTNYNQIVGTYKTPEINGISYGTAKIKYLKNNIFNFEIFTVTSGGNIGDLKGKMKINNGIGKYYDRHCKELEFVFNRNVLTVKSKDCMQGMNAFFDGKYEKK